MGVFCAKYKRLGLATYGELPVSLPLPTPNPSPLGRGEIVLHDPCPASLQQSIGTANIGHSQWQENLNRTVV